MDLIGDIERGVAQLWPYRVPIAIMLVALAAATLWVAWRRDWLGVAAAHPRVTALAVVLIMVIGLPAAWLLGSPLFIRTELVEEPAAALARGESSGVLLEGEFMGADDFHFGSGQARIVESAPGQLVLQLQDFSVLNGPDLFVYVSSDPAGWTADALNLGTLKATDGSFSYEIPEGVEVADIGSAVIWCRAFAVQFASAALEPATA